MHCLNAKFWSLLLMLLMSLHACNKLNTEAGRLIVKQQKTLNEFTVLPASYYPYTYSVLLDDYESAWEYIMSVFNVYEVGDEWGYFMLSVSEDTSSIYIARIMESDSEFDTAMQMHSDYPYVVVGGNTSPIIIVDNDGNEAYDDVACVIHRTFRNAYDMERWIERRQSRGYIAKSVGSDKHGRYVCISYR